MKIIKNLMFFLFVISSNMLIMESCSNNIEEDESNEFCKTSVNEDYLTIDEFLTKHEYSNSENEILLEAKRRINNAIIIVDGRYSLEDATAESLKMSEDIFNDFQEVLSLANQSKSKNVSLRCVRLKSEHFESGSAYCDYVGEAIYSVAGTLFEQQCFENYWNRGGDMALSTARFYDLLGNVNNQNSWKVVNIDGQNYYEEDVSFYGNSNYDFAFGGTAKIYYDINGNPVGFYDEYDFNNADRSLIPEAVTRLIGTLGQGCDAMDYTITYGIHK